jgi:A/G-specific adenine glycosylase
MLDFSSRLIAWQKIHGRHDLPWQNTRDPYAIWVSEIMLQQTQVAAVIAYYQRFMQRFPDIARLAQAAQEEVLQYWSGLGYYSRARNLHAAAQAIMSNHNGAFPHNFDDVQALPGIGRSTAAAIVAFAHHQPQPILDGNVKRVFARHFLVEGWPGLPKIEKQLWLLAEQLLPQADMSAYTQGLMDLGATLCTRTKPKCMLCPLRETCQAYISGRWHELPAPKPRKAMPEKHVTMLLLLHGNEILLEKRPPTGIWGGLWSLPEVDIAVSTQAWTEQRYGLVAETLPPLPLLTHGFTHFRLHITPQPMQVSAIRPAAQEAGLVWLPLGDAIGAALPTPVRKLLLQIKKAA